jgi:hypothetical protein
VGQTQRRHKQGKRQRREKGEILEESWRGRDKGDMNMNTNKNMNMNMIMNMTMNVFEVRAKSN